MPNHSTRPDEHSPLAVKQAFLRLPIEERRKILDRQAVELAAHYAQNDEWRDIEGADIIDYDRKLQS